MNKSKSNTSNNSNNNNNNNQDYSRHEELTRLMMIKLLELYHSRTNIPEYGGQSNHVELAASAYGFKDYLYQYLPRESPILKAFFQQSLFTQRGNRLSPKVLLKRIDHLYEQETAENIRLEVQKLSSNVVMALQIETFVDALSKFDGIVLDQTGSKTCILDQVEISTDTQIDEISQALIGHKTLEELVLIGNNIGSKETKVTKQFYLDLLTNALKTIKTFRSLTLSANQIKSTQINLISRLKDLQSLDISNNNIGDRGGEILGESIRQLSNLVSLDVSRCNIGDSGLSSICHGLQKNGPCGLIDFRVAYNKFKSSAWNSLSTLLSGAPYLIYFDISGNTLPFMNGDAAVLANALKQNISVETLKIASMFTDSAITPQKKSNNDFMDYNPRDVLIADRSMILLQGVIKSKHLTCLDISNNNITPFGIATLCNYLVSSELQTLNLAWNDIRSNGAAQLSKLLRSGKSKITSLDVSYNRISNDGVSKILKIIAPKATAKPFVYLSVAGNIMQKSEVRSVINYLNTPEATLKHLDISDCACPLAYKLSQIAQKNKSLQVLKMARNDIHLAGESQLADEFASQILSHPALTVLDLSFNLVGDDGALAFARYLGENTVLLSLDLTHNALGKPAAYGLGRGIANNVSLIELQMPFNYVGPRGASALLDMLNGKDGMASMDVSGFGAPYRLLHDENGTTSAIFKSRLDSRNVKKGKTKKLKKLQKIEAERARMSKSVKGLSSYSRQKTFANRNVSIDKKEYLIKKQNSDTSVQNDQETKGTRAEMSHQSSLHQLQGLTEPKSDDENDDEHSDHQPRDFDVEPETDKKAVWITEQISMMANNYSRDRSMLQDQMLQLLAEQQALQMKKQKEENEALRKEKIMSETKTDGAANKDGAPPNFEEIMQRLDKIENRAKEMKAVVLNDNN